MNYSESISNLDDMIFAREWILFNIRNSFSGSVNRYSFMTHKKLTDYGLKIYRECEKLKAIRAEMYILEKYKKNIVS